MRKSSVFLKGFLILLFGTLLDSKILVALARKMGLRNSSHMSTSARPSTSSRSFFLRRFRIRNVYNISNSSSLSAASSNSSDASIGRV
ncbi:uncharacterized protein LOC113660900 [Tachysurus fulvidraco]|uniref:uncharacterized protein LOC113660900 n=1 Tax=Tachysurus fulvidraco TaxID=1234273 RepID=UPI001FEE4D1F|nr:uncharacterized protein LOC113660900 [Tachysurus fulvidraco]